MPAMGPAQPSPLATWALHLRNPPLRAGFGIGFCILFAFIGTFTFVNFVLTREPLSLGAMQLGFVYFVFLPSIFTTPLAGRTVQRIGTKGALWAGLATAAVALPLLVSSSLPAVLVGMVLMGVGTFFAQATATGFVSRTATVDRGAASGIYLACYFLGGLVGTAVLGQVFDRLGWTATVIGVGVALAVAAALTAQTDRDAGRGVHEGGVGWVKRSVDPTQFLIPHPRVVLGHRSRSTQPTRRQCAVTPAGSARACRAAWRSRRWSTAAARGRATGR